MLFRGAHYLGSTNGLLVTKDQGASWQEQGAAVNIWQGPFIGRDEKEMLVIGRDGVFMTRNAGATWKQVAGLKPKEGGFCFHSELVWLLRLGPGEEHPLRVLDGEPCLQARSLNHELISNHEKTPIA